MMRLGIRGRLTAWYGVTLAVILLGFGLTVYFLMRHSLFARLEYALGEELIEMQKEVELAHDLADLQTQFRVRFGRHANYEFEVTREAGESLFHSERLGVSRLRTVVFSPQPRTRVSQTQSLLNLGDYLVAGDFVDSPHGPLVLQVAMPLEAIRADLRTLLWVLFTSGPLALLTALAGGNWLARTALVPVERITATANEITARHLDRRLEVPPTDDELSRLSDTLNRMINRLQHSFEEMRRFTADAAHELRTPLAVIRNQAEVARRAARSPEEYQRVLDSVIEETRHLSLLADQLLQLCRADADLTRQDRQPLALDELLVEAAESFIPAARHKEITIDLNLAESIVTTGDSVQLRQLWRNLLDNAVKYTPNNGLVCISAFHRGQHAVVEIVDNGIGIPAEHLPHVFDRFYRVDSSRHRDTGGAGLGLAICRAIVDSHGGDIQIDSTPGHGTRVTVVLKNYVSV